MSPRVACRLEGLGFADVYDYAGGKMDWLSADLPYEGEVELVSRVVRRDPIVAGLRDPVEQIADRILADPAGMAVVAAENGIVQGVLGGAQLKDAPPRAVAEDVMRFGITTVRPSEEVGPLLHRMDEAGVSEIVVTRSDGVLVGVLAVAAVRSPRSGP
jgi:predicted transcriptional regulator